MTRKPIYRDDNRLRSGHCKLLNSYKKRLKQIYLSSCLDCGLDPHDVPHMLNFTAHPTDLSTVNLWDKPVKPTRQLSELSEPGKHGLTDEDG